MLRGPAIQRRDDVRWRYTIWGAPRYDPLIPIPALVGHRYLNLGVRTCITRPLSTRLRASRLVRPWTWAMWLSHTSGTER